MRINFGRRVLNLPLIPKEKARTDWQRFSGTKFPYQVNVHHPTKVRGVGI